MACITLAEYFPSVQDGGQNSLSVYSRNMCKPLKDKPPTGEAVVSVLILSTLRLLMVMWTPAHSDTNPKLLVTSFISISSQISPEKL